MTKKNDMLALIEGLRLFWKHENIDYPRPPYLEEIRVKDARRLQELGLLPVSFSFFEQGLTLYPTSMIVNGDKMMYFVKCTENRIKAVDALISALISAPVRDWQYFCQDGHNPLATARIRLKGISYGIPYAGDVSTLHIYVPDSDRGRGFGLGLDPASRKRLSEYAINVRNYIRRQKDNQLDNILSDYHIIESETGEDQ